MSYELLPLFILTIFILAVLPGPGVLLTVARATMGGKKSGIQHAAFTVAGIVVGDIIFILLVTLGLKFIAESLSTLFIIIKYVGSAYLIWLGFSLIVNSLKSKGEDITQEALQIEKTRSTKTTFAADFIAGVVVTLSNPKAIVFYLSFFPAFMDLTALTAMDITVITLLITTIIGATMLGYAFAAIHAKALLHSGNNSANKEGWVKRIAGGLIMSTGGWLLIRQ